MRVSNFSALLRTSMDAESALRLESILSLPADIAAAWGPRVSRRVFTMALNAVLLHDLLRRVPSGAGYVSDRVRNGERLVFDHGAVRTISLPGHPGGALLSGEHALARILGPLGYSVRGVYPLTRLRMTGRSYAHDDGDADIPQFFVSELHAEQFPPEFQAAAERVFGSSREPLNAAGQALLQSFSSRGEADMTLACAGLPNLAGCFARQHDLPVLADYEALLAHSKEAAWMATEGNAFNHATDRVVDLEAVAEEQRRVGRRVKEHIEVSRSGRVRQTALRADPVERLFRCVDGAIVHRQVPGSFFEFISRAPLRAGTAELDLGFDSGNAQGIFRMTEAVATQAVAV